MLLQTSVPTATDEYLTLQLSHVRGQIARVQSEMDFWLKEENRVHQELIRAKTTSFSFSAHDRQWHNKNEQMREIKRMGGASSIQGHGPSAFSPLRHSHSDGELTFAMAERKREWAILVQQKLPIAPPPLLSNALPAAHQSLSSPIARPHPMGQKPFLASTAASIVFPIGSVSDAQVFNETERDLLRNYLAECGIRCMPEQLLWADTQAAGRVLVTHGFPLPEWYRAKHFDPFDSSHNIANRSAAFFVPCRICHTEERAKFNQQLKKRGRKSRAHRGARPCSDE